VNKTLRTKETLSMVDMKTYDVITSTPQATLTPALTSTPSQTITPAPVNFKLMVRAELTDDEICLNVGKEIKLNSKLFLLNKFNIYENKCSCI
jgi:hypothetical protein